MLRSSCRDVDVVDSTVAVPVPAAGDIVVTAAVDVPCEEILSSSSASSDNRGSNSNAVGNVKWLVRIAAGVIAAVILASSSRF